MDPLNWIQTHIPPWLFITLIVHVVVLGAVAYLILLERKTASWVQDRIGPNRVGLGFGIIPGLKDFHFWGLGQPLADGLKFIMKEDYRPKHADFILFTLAPAIMVIVIIISIATVPWGGTKQSTTDVEVASALHVENNQAFAEKVSDENSAEYQQAVAQARKSLPIGDQVVSIPEHAVTVTGNTDGTYSIAVAVNYQYAFQIADLNIGVLYILAMLSLAVYGVVIGGWASNNKYSFLGGLRATANMISYEIPLGLAVLAIVLMFGTLDLNEMVNKQAQYWHLFGVVPLPAWNVFAQPLAFILFLVCIHAEANRAPFDLAEAEQELVGGYHTEYSAMRFALFFLAEYAGMVTTSAVCVAMFFGGWHFPGLDRLVCWIVNFLTHPGNAWVDPTNPAVTNSLTLCIVRGIVVFVKTLLIIFVFMWVRWSLPRFRFDQLMMLAWRALIPMSLALLMATAVVIYLYPSSVGASRTPGEQALALLAANVLVLVGSMLVSVLIPSSYETNKKMRVPGSRYTRTPLPAPVPKARSNEPVAR